MCKLLILIVAGLMGLLGCASREVVSDEIDNTNYLQSLFDSPEKEIIIPAKEDPWITRPLFITASDKKIIFSVGCRIQAKRGSFRDPGDCLLTVADSDNLIFEGNGAVLGMHKKDYTSPTYKKGEWRHGISILRSRNIVIDGFTVQDTGGDGVYIGQKAMKAVCENITLKNLVLINNHRQGISVTAVRTLLIEDCLITGTKGTPPMAGIDFEPNSDAYGLTGCIIRNSVFEKNRGAGIQVYLEKMTATQPPVEITVENTVSRKNLSSTAIYAIPKGVRGTVTFTGCRLSGLRWIWVPKSFSVKVYPKTETR